MKTLPIVWPSIDGHVGADAARTEWESIVADYEADPGNVYLAWLYLGHHPIFWETEIVRHGQNVLEPTLNFSSAWGRRHCLELTMSHDGDGPVVTLELEPVPWSADDDVHRMMCDNDTYENVIIDAASAVHAMFGNDREFLIQDDEGRWYG